jgi:hypothetical protein
LLSRLAYAFQDTSLISGSSSAIFSAYSVRNLGNVISRIMLIANKQYIKKMIWKHLEKFMIPTGFKKMSEGYNGFCNSSGFIEKTFIMRFSILSEKFCMRKKT